MSAQSIDRRRIDEVADHLISRLDEAHGADRWRLDDIAVTAAVVYQDDEEEGVERESPVTVFSTKRRYVQLGLMEAAAIRARQFV